MSFKKNYVDAKASYKPMKRGRIKPRFSRKRSVDGDSGRDIRDDCDQIVREIIALRDSKCVTCPATSGLQVGHYFNRGKFRVRWNLQNVAGQCEGCNVRHNTEPEHYLEAFIMKHGEQTYNELKAESRRGPFSYGELCDIRDELRSELAKLKEAA